MRHLKHTIGKLRPFHELCFPQMAHGTKRFSHPLWADKSSWGHGILMAACTISNRYAFQTRIENDINLFPLIMYWWYTRLVQKKGAETVFWISHPSPRIYVLHLNAIQWIPKRAKTVPPVPALFIVCLWWQEVRCHFQDGQGSSNRGSAS